MKEQKDVAIVGFFDDAESASVIEADNLKLTATEIAGGKRIAKHYMANKGSDNGLIKKLIAKRAIIIQISIALLLAALIAVVDLCIVPLQYISTYWLLPSVGAAAPGETRVHFLSNGIDCTIIEFSDGKTAIIDGGANDVSARRRVFRYVNSLNVDRFDYLILTSATDDAIGCLDEVASYYGADRVYMPYVSNYYNFSRTSLLKNSTSDCYCEIIERYKGFYGKDYSLTFLSPSSLDNPTCEYYTANKTNASEYDINGASAVIWLNAFEVDLLLYGNSVSAVQERLASENSVNAFSAADGKKINLKTADAVMLSNGGKRSYTSISALRYVDAAYALSNSGADGESEVNAVKSQLDDTDTTFLNTSSYALCLTITEESYTINEID